MMMHRRGFLGQMAAGAAGLEVRRAFAAGRKPNIVVIVADDLGWGETGVQGFKNDIPTPYLDSLAWNGVRFTNGYSSCPVCSPTRAGLMTGRYQQRFGHESNFGGKIDPKVEFGLPLAETTMADRLKALGYKTGAVGKWHLGEAPQFHPMKRGFDEFYGFLGGARSFFPAKGNAADLRGYERVQETEYTTDAYAGEAESFIERHKAEPFFLYLSFNAVNAPLEATKKYLNRFRPLAGARIKELSNPKRHVFAAMLSAMDDGVGRVLNKLRDTGLEEDTLIFFLADNGGEEYTSSSNGPLLGEKRDLWEGGIRVPFMMQWKGHLPKAKVYNQPIISLDICPTALAAATGSVPAGAKLDGVNLLPYLTEQRKEAPHEILYWRHWPEAAVRKADWKLVMLDDGSRWLFNLSRDIGEKRNLAFEEPAKAAELLADYEAWNRQLAMPLWHRGPATKMRQAIGGAR